MDSDKEIQARVAAQNDVEHDAAAEHGAEPDSAADVEHAAAPSLAAPQERGPATDAPSPPLEQSRSESTGKFKRRLAWLGLLAIILALMALFVYAALRFQRDLQLELSHHERALDALRAELETAQQERVRWREDLRQRQDQIAADDSDYEQRINLVEERLAAQNKRLLSMSTTSREDWLLAEAEYLLKLANQRVLIERNAGASVALLTKADAILRDLDDPDLYSLRAAIQDDLIKLKLVEAIDVEGIYLRLGALARQVEQIPFVKNTFEHATETQAGESEDAAPQSSLKRFLRTLGGYYRIIDDSEKPEVLLPPDASAYLYLNLRMSLEQAQLALLREQQAIYNSSLEQSLRWLNRYFPGSSVSQRFSTELTELLEIKVVRDLPDISASLELLRAYIENLHQLGGSQAKEEREALTQ